MKKIISIVLVVAWMIVIFILSNEDANKTTDTTNFILRLLGINSNTFLFILVRKLAHFSEYFILGLLLHNMFNNFKINNYYVLVLICIIYACSDEIHQLFIKGRTCSVIDVLIDTLGSSLYIFINKIKNKLLKN